MEAQVGAIDDVMERFVKFCNQLQDFFNSVHTEVPPSAFESIFNSIQLEVQTDIYVSFTDIPTNLTLLS